MVDPFEAVASKFAFTLKKFNPKIKADVEDIRYGAAYYIHYYSVILCELLIGFFTNDLKDSIIALISLGLFIEFTGPVHFKSLFNCFIVTVSVLGLIIQINLDWVVVLSLNIFALVINLVTRNESNNKRMISLLITTNLFFSSSTFVLIYLIQTIFIKLKGR